MFVKENCLFVIGDVQERGRKKTKLSHSKYVTDTNMAAKSVQKKTDSSSKCPTLGAEHFGFLANIEIHTYSFIYISVYVFIDVYTLVGVIAHNSEHTYADICKSYNTFRDSFTHLQTVLLTHAFRYSNTTLHSHL